MINIYFDMDGTLADLYNVSQWESKLHNEDATPYNEAQPCGNLNQLITLLNRYDVRVGVISWCSMNGSKDFNKDVRKAKREWIKRYFPIVKEYHIIKYGTPKHLTIERAKRNNAVLVDDDLNVCMKWQGVAITFTTYDEMLVRLENYLRETA